MSEPLKYRDSTKVTNNRYLYTLSNSESTKAMQNWFQFILNVDVQSKRDRLLYKKT